LNLKRRENAPLIAQILMLALLLGSLPIAASPIILRHESAPAFTLDICTPLSSFAIGAAACSLPTLTTSSFAVMIEHRRLAHDSIPSAADRAFDAPDPPPPKALV
jgi:hypothetical protein